MSTFLLHSNCISVTQSHYFFFTIPYGHLSKTHPPPEQVIPMRINQNTNSLFKSNMENSSRRKFPPPLRFNTNNRIGSSPTFNASSSSSSSPSSSSSSIPQFRIQCQPSDEGSSESIDKTQCAEEGEEKEMDSSVCYVHRNIFGNEEIHFANSVVIHGNVEKGSIIHSNGSVIILGSLEGEVHVGEEKEKRRVEKEKIGNEEDRGKGKGRKCGSFVFALSMNPSRLSIGGKQASVHGCRPYPEMATLSEDESTISIQPAQNESNQNNKQNNEQRNTNQSTTQNNNKNNQSGFKSTARIALFTGAYIAIAGIALIVFPKQVFGLFFDLNFISSGWIRVFGVLALVFGVYYLGSGYADYCNLGLEGFYVATVYGRLLLFSIFCWIVAIGELQASLLVLGIINMIGALFMLHALRKRWKQTSIQNE